MNRYRYKRRILLSCHLQYADKLPLRFLTLNSLMKTSLLFAFPIALFLTACGGTSSETAETESIAEAPSEPPTRTEDGWTVFFNNDTKEGWTQFNGKADYEIKDGVVIGTTKTGEPNSFLATNKDYSDFVLEYEVKVDTALNSGVQIRSNQYANDTTMMITNSEGEETEREFPKDRVYGYQVELDPSPRSYSGGIYEEAGRGWLHDLSDNPEAREAFNPDDWNQFRVEAIGDTLRTYVNGVLATDIVDDKTASGFIALQVHGIPDDKPGPYQVMWRNIRIKEM